jgi:hypothetical protein
MLTRVLIAVVLILGLAGAVSAEEIKVQSVGITDHVVTQEELEKGEALAKPKFDSPGIAHGLVTNVKKGDTVEVSLNKDGQSLMHNTRTLDADEDHVLLQAGKRGVPAGGWPKGAYTAKVKVTRGDEELFAAESDAFTFE